MLSEWVAGCCRNGWPSVPEYAPLLSKLQAAAVFDINVVSNEAGEHAFMTSPGAFHKFTSPLIDDAFDHAKALVSALRS